MVQYYMKQLYVHTFTCTCKAEELLFETTRHCFGTQSHTNTIQISVVSEYILHCRSSCTPVSDMQDLLQDQARWTLVHKSIQEFQLRTSVLYKVLKYANGRGHYQELFVQLDCSKYYGD